MGDRCEGDEQRPPFAMPSEKSIAPRATRRHCKGQSMGKVNEENVKTGQQGTNEPWKKPDQSDHHPDKDSPNPRPRRPEDNKTS
jgi:hypothetical protein